MYIVPQALVYQEFELLPTAITEPLRAFICGPNYAVFKYGVGHDNYIDIGQYNSAAQVAVAWPTPDGAAWAAKLAGSVVDQAYARLFIKNALLRYFRSTADDSINVVSTTDTTRVETAGSAFNSGAFPFTRAVAPGDVVHLAATISDELVEHWTYVVAVEGVPTASTAAATGTAGARNASANVAGGVTVSAGATGGFSAILAASFTSSYKGCRAGYVTETYTITVVEGSDFDAEGDAMTVNVTSGSGTDDRSNLVITRGAGSTTDFTVTTRGLVFAVPNGPYAANDTITITVKEVYAAPTLTIIDTTAYNGTKDTTYIVEVVEGNEEDAAPNTGKLRIKTSNGYDGFTELVDVIDGNFATADGTPIALGTHGVTFYFDIATSAKTALVKGDTWTVACTAATTGLKKRLVLADALPADLVTNTPVLTVSLYMQKDIEVPRLNNEGGVNWTPGVATVTIKPGVYGYDSAVTDAAGDLVQMPVEGSAYGTTVNQMYVQYRTLLQGKAASINTIDNLGDIAEELGDIDVDNPLAMGVFFALTNSNGTPVKYMAVPTDDLAGYTAVVDKLYDRKDVYSVVPMSKLQSVQTLVAGHATSMSSAENGRWRIALLNSDATEELGMVVPAAGSEYTAAFEYEAATRGNTLVTWASGTFIDNGVVAGDILRTDYEVDGTYQEFVVQTVISNTQLRLATGPTVAATKRFEVWHTNSKNDVAAAYAAKSGSFGSRRVYHVWPDKIDFGAQLVEGFYACAAVAGLISGVAPQQGLTNLAITGFSAVTRTVNYFNTAQLNTMAEGGTFIITQDQESGAIHTRHQLSTDTTDLNSSELSVVKNVDSISYLFLRRLAPYVGISNITDTLIDRITNEIVSATDYLKGSGFIPRLGGQLIDASILELHQHAVLRDRLVVVLDLQIPYPLNNIEVHLVV